MGESELAKKVIEVVKGVDKLAQNIRKDTARVRKGLEELKALQERMKGK